MQYTVVWFYQTGHHGYHEVDRETGQEALAEVSEFYNPDFLRKCTMSVFKGLPFRDRAKYTRLVERLGQL